MGSTPETAPNARGFDRFFGFHSGCIDYYSHRYYWGEPKTVNYHDLWSDGTEVMETLAEYHLNENTFVMFTADNGATREKRAGLNQQIPDAGHKGIFRGYKFSAFDGGMHPPMIMNWPGVIPSGQVIDEVGCHIDILPTLCNAAAAQVPPDRIIDGRNALPMATARAKSPHEAIYWASNNQLAVRKGKWKLVKDGIVFDGTPEGSKPLTGDEALFLSNLHDDPGETKNLRHEAPDVVDELASQASEWLKDVTRNQ